MMKGGLMKKILLTFLLGFTISSAQAATYYVATTNYGIYKSTNSGASWAPSNGTANVISAPTGPKICR